MSAGPGVLRSASVRRAAIVLVGAAAFAALALDLVAGDYRRFIAGSVAVNAVTVLSLSVLAGTSGIWSLGHTAFIALGAYLAANLAVAGIPLEVIVPFAAIVAAVVGYVLGLAAGRFSILYFALLTLAVALTTVELVGRLVVFTGGDQGLPVPSMRSWLWGDVTPDNAPQVAVALATAAFVLCDLVVKGAPGRRWRAVKSQRVSATAIGMTPFLANANALAFSAALAAVGGVGLALILGYLDPLTFNLNSGIMLVVGTVVGGIGSVLGALVGAAFIVGVPEAGRSVPDLASFGLGGTMILVLLLMPRGLAPTLLSLVARALGLEGRRAPEVQNRAVDPAAIADLARALMPSSTQTLRFTDVSVAFGGLSVLRDVSLDVAPGRTVGLIGPNGAGKTTLINVLSGFVKPSSGSLALGETDLSRSGPQARLALGIGRTFQHAELFSDLTIRETLSVAASRRPRRAGAPPQAEIVARILDALKLEAVADAHPEELPFGIQKVADIARMLAAGAAIVALDEPFSGLDGVEMAELRAILAGLKAAGVSVLIIDHAVQEVLDVADHVLVLNFGTLLASGSPAQISRDPEVQAAYFGSAARRGTGRAAGETKQPVLVEAIDLRHRYGGVLALDGVSLAIERGSFTAVLGPNGAGKSTLAQILGGLVRPSGGRVSLGPGPARSGHAFVRDGVSLVAEGRRLFGGLTIEENLIVAGYGAGLSRARTRARIRDVAGLLPDALRTGMGSRVTMTLSGGERQIVALARALMAEPRLLIIDEPSMGLAPIMTERVYQTLSDLNRAGTAVVVVEQIATQAMEHADVVHLLSRGRVIHRGPPTSAATAAAIQATYVGHVEDAAE